MSLRFYTAGESHGPALLAILEGIPAGLEVTADLINKELARRQRGYGAGPRMKLEKDEVKIMGGVMQAMTTGAPVGLLIENRDHAKWKGQAVKAFPVPRPGHADLVGAIKYGYRDLRPALERASARETAGRVAVGAVCKHFLGQFNIQVGAYVVSIGEVRADLGDIPLTERLELAEATDVRCPDLEAAEAMRAHIRQAIEKKETLGGIIEVVASGIPPGLGSYVHWERRLDSRLAAAVMSVQAMKGVEIGSAFANTRLPGSQVQDAIYLEGKRLMRKTNFSGGLEAGVTTGEPVILRAAMKPIATTLTPQHSVDLASQREVETQYERSDFCPVPRAVPILEAMVAFVIADALLEKVGGDSILEISGRVASLRGADLDDVIVDGEDSIFWGEG
jgi:chorismate synthase